ncbi:MAG TPA: 50S ribosomal protein L24 [Candidatus Binatia bacterium]|nr:50S ribosomal protein L24 [Candidatus Binatia bacterium]
MAKQNIKKGDTVIVIAGRDKGKTGKVVRLVHEDGKIIIERIAVVKRHRKPRGQEPGGILEKETPIHISNVMLLDPATNKPTRVGRKIIEHGGKRQSVRVARVSGETVDAK